MPVIEKRYAEALFHISLEQDILNQITEEFGQCIEATHEIFLQKSFWKHPRISPEDKKIVLQEALSGKISSYLYNLILVLLKKERLHILTDVYLEFKKMADAKRSILNIDVISPWALDQEQLKRIASQYKLKYKYNEVRVENIVDQQLIGGIKIQVADKVEDSTIKSHLDKLRHQLLSV